MSTSVRQENITETQGTEMNLSGAEKVAILILCLGEERGSEMMKRLDEKEIQLITRAISDIGPVHADVAEQVISEFASSLTAREGDTSETAKKMLMSFLPEDKVASIMEDIGSSSREGEFWQELGSVDEKSIAEYLALEQNQTIAVVASNLPSDVAARVLPHLGQERMLEVIERMLQIEEVPDHLLQQIEEALRTDVLANSEDASERVAARRMADVFNKFDEAVFETIATHLNERTPEEFGRIRDHMFTFSDLIKIEGQDLARVMRGVSGNTVPLALKGTKDELREHFLSALPGRSRDMLVEEMDNMGAVRVRDVRAAQDELVACAKQLIDQDVIKLPVEGADEDEYIE